MGETLYKCSKYNIIVNENKESGEITLFNTCSCKSVTMSKEDYNDLKDEQNVDLCDLPEQLVVANMFVPQELDELAILKEFSYKATHREDTLTFTIAITRKCNYRCSYCFEKDSLCNESMSLETQQAVIDFIIRKCEEYKGLKTLYLEWFGGEPTLAYDIILNITQGILDYTNKNKIYVSSGIITNGRLFTNEFVEKIQICNLKHAQITLDGTAKVYAKAKGCTETDFYKVIENIKAVQDKVNIQIRLNIDNNIEDIKRLLLFLAKENLKVKVYYHQIENIDYTINERIKAYEQYICDAKELETFIKQNNYEYLFFANRFVNKMEPCIACSENAYLIDTKGLLYGCEYLIFQEKQAIGNVYQGRIKPFFDVLSNNPYDYSTCNDCDSCKFIAHCLCHCHLYRLCDKNATQEQIDYFNKLKIQKFI